MDQHELLRHAAETLDRLKIPYLVTGSFAGILYGEYRMTNDIDIVVELKVADLDEFLAAFPEEVFYVEREAALDAIRNRFQFNVIHRESLTKIDFIISQQNTHDRETMRRARRIRAAIDHDISYSSPEDLILKKLLFYKESGSPKHMRDCAGILKKSQAELDWAYLEKWANWLDVYKAWEQAKALATASSE